MKSLKMVAVLVVLGCLGLGVYALLPVFGIDNGSTAIITPTGGVPAKAAPTGQAPAVPQQPRPTQLPAQKILTNGGYHVFQTFNNCAPAGLSIALSYYGIAKTQEALAAELRPYNNPQGINDDKSTVPQELADKAKEYGLIPYYRPNGDIDILKQFIALDIPVVMRTLLHDYENFAHYRVVKGYDDTTKEIVQDDSYQNKNLRYAYGDFLALWQEFGYEYLVLVPLAKQAAAEAILRDADALDPATAWRNAVRAAESELQADLNDIRARFNLVVALHATGDNTRAVAEFEKIESRLPAIKLWYQLQPIQAYFDLGNHDRVLAMTAAILAKNISYSELYLLRGQVYLKRGQTDLAKAEFEKALFYNKNSKSAQEAVASVGAG